MDTSISVTQLIDIASKGGAIAILAVFLWGFWAEKWVSGAAYQRALKERDEYRQELFNSWKVAERASHLTERAADLAESRLEAERQLRILRLTEAREPRDL